MKEVKIEQCPYCGGEEFIETKLCSYGSAYLIRTKHVLLHTASVYATVCRDCGSIVRSFIKNPEKLFPKKERKNN